MKKHWKFITIVLLSLIFTLSGYNSSSGAVRWYDFNTGTKLAAKYKKPIIISFFSRGCHWCTVMDRETFSNSTVTNRLRRHYIPVRIYVDSNDTVKYKSNTYTVTEFSRHIGVQGLPTTVFMERNGKFITKIPGFIKPDIFIPLLNYIRQECYKKKVSFKDYVNGRANCK